MGDFTLKIPFNVPAFLLSPTYEIVKGVKKKTFIKSETPFFCSFETFGGTEREVNGLTVVENTGVLKTWYNPQITSEHGVSINGIDYEILGTPENINMRNQFMQFKVRAIKGGA